jgi:hypothetical protein
VPIGGYVTAKISPLNTFATGLYFHFQYFGQCGYVSAWQHVHLQAKQQVFSLYFWSHCFSLQRLQVNFIYGVLTLALLGIVPKLAAEVTAPSKLPAAPM